MIPDLDPLLDCRCPHCAVSLRFRWLRRRPFPGLPPGHEPYACPACQGPLFERRHPALADNWRWSRFYLPGVALCALGIFVPSLGGLLPLAVAVLGLGLVALLVYMVRERWGWKRYGAEPPQP